MTPEQMRHAQEEFRRALDASVPPDQINQLELHTPEEEEFIQNEVERKLHKPKLPNAGKLERLWLQKLKQFARDESLVVMLKAAAGRYAIALEGLLPHLVDPFDLHQWCQRQIDHVHFLGQVSGMETVVSRPCHRSRAEDVERQADRNPKHRALGAVRKAGPIERRFHAGRVP